MDHEQALAMKAVERYTLGEMTEQQAQEFELHYFECAECSLEVDASMTFAAEARSVMAAERSRSAPSVAVAAPPQAIASRPPQGPSWADRFAGMFGLLTGRTAMAAATFCLIAVSGYQNVAVIPALRRAAVVNSQPQALMAFHLMGAVRGSAPVLAIPRDLQQASVSFDPVWDVRASNFFGVLQKQDGTRVAAFPLQPPAPGQPVAVLLPAGVIQPGTYSLSVFAGSQSDTGGELLARFAFELQHRQEN